MKLRSNTEPGSIFPFPPISLNLQIPSCFKSQTPHNLAISLPTQEPPRLTYYTTKSKNKTKKSHNQHSSPRKTISSYPPQILTETPEKKIDKPSNSNPQRHENSYPPIHSFKKSFSTIVPTCMQLTRKVLE